MIWSDIPGFFDWPDIYDDWAERCDPESGVVEVGVWRGRSLAYLCTKLQERGIVLPLLYGVDSWLPSEIPELKSVQDQLGGADAVAQEFSDNMHRCGLHGMFLAFRGTSEDAAQRFKDKALRFCFIDADHAYESVLADLRAWSPKMRPGGQMAGHDMTENWPGVRQAVQEFFGDRWRQQGTCWVVDF